MVRIASKNYYFAVGAFFVVLLILHYTAILRPTEDWLRNLLIPFLSDTHGLSIKTNTNYQFFANRDEFIKAYGSCIRESESCAVANTQQKLLVEENTELRRQLNFFSKINIAHVLADVIGKEILSTDQTVIINRGKDYGISVGDPVVVGEGIMVGKIIKVENNTAIIRLLNDNESRIGATIVNKDKSEGVVEGGFGISLQMNLIPRDEVVIVGGKVVTSGLERSVPRGLLIGTVAAVQNEPYKPFQQAILTPATNLEKIELVSVLLTK
jgi:rod shape-determining protein MreC